ncbi:hypothetical protein G9A89_008314 [Geosiphon pyriformis]|nr:hypothetical protein G9A89_008314 [Geosiphon pyriformis]
MAYQDIAKLEKFSEEENNAYLWIVEAKKTITTNNWNDDRAIQVLPFFLTGTTNLCILRSVKPHYLTNLQDTIAFTCDFEFAEQETKHTQAINLAINRTFNIDAKITQLKKITTTANIYSNRTISNSNNLGDLIPITVTTKKNNRPKFRKPISATKILAKPGIPIFHTSKSTASVCTTSSIHSTTTPELLSIIINNPSNSSLLNSSLQPVQTNSRPSQPIPCASTEYLNQASYLSFMEDQGFNKSTSQTKSNILPATITENTTLAAIFSFDIDNLNTHSLFSGAAIN